MERQARPIRQPRVGATAQARQRGFTVTPTTPPSPGHPHGPSPWKVLPLQKEHVGVRWAHPNLRVLRVLPSQPQDGPRFQRPMSSAGHPCPHGCQKDTEKKNRTDGMPSTELSLA